MPAKRRTRGAVRRRAEAELLEEYTAESPAPVATLVDSVTTRATPCPADPQETEETLP